MTTEVVLMNRAAVALAADSAVTVAGSKVYNTANKVFTLSKYAPVGIMIYSSADFLGIPWETIIKDYRSKLKTKRFKTLSEYAEDFLNYLTNTPFFKQENKDFQLHLTLNNLGSIFLIGEKEKLDFYEISKTIEKYINYLSTKNYVDGFSDEDSVKIIQQIEPLIPEILDLYLKDKNIENYEHLNESFTTLLSLALTREPAFPIYSGIVITGFGESEVYPSLETFKIDGYICNKLRVIREPKRSIGLENRAEIIPFAQTQMIESILDGALPSYKEQIFNLLEPVLQQIPEMIINEIAELTPDQKDANIQKFSGLDISFQRLINNTLQRIHTDHQEPMRNAVALLPKSELAIAAETLIHVAQLEHRLSLMAETVGGPVDVALITKGDGLVWIKRKHYFDPAFNLGFVENYYSKDYIQEATKE